jgi:hypothetical protein
MQLFSCAGCGQTVYFDNRFCVRCERKLAFCPSNINVEAIDLGSYGHYTLTSNPQRAAKLCVNSSNDICNWLADDGSTDGFCQACEHNRLVPDVSTDAGINQWQKLSQAQRHLYYSLLRLDLPRPARAQDPDGGLVFDFLVDEVQQDGSVQAAMTGHDEGVIAIRAAEADDLVREEVKDQMNEPYRTMLGHFRHEIGHFIWNKKVRDAGQLDECRAVFGDEREDYGEALKRNYAEGPRPDWPAFFISSYASIHPWEDFAECFAHYLHIVDTLETAHSFGIKIDPEDHDDISTELAFDPYKARSAKRIVSAWVPLTVAMNSLQRSMGEKDLYPFVLTPAVMDKLEYMHRLLHRSPPAQQTPV